MCRPVVILLTQYAKSPWLTSDFALLGRPTCYWAIAGQPPGGGFFSETGLQREGLNLLYDHPRMPVIARWRRRRGGTPHGSRLVGLPGPCSDARGASR